MAKHEPVGSPFFKLIKNDVYQYLESRVADARDRGKEFSRPILGDAAIQVLIETIRQRQGGNDKAQVETVMGKVNPVACIFLNQYLSQLKLKSLERSSVTLPVDQRKQLIDELKPVVRMSAARRAALIDVVRNVLPKVDGSLRSNEFAQALEDGNVDGFIDWEDVEKEVS